MTPAHRRHDITDQIWERLQPHLPGGAEEGAARPGNRLFLDAVFWNLALGLPGGTCHRTRGTGRTPSAASVAGGRGVWADLLDQVIDDPDLGPDLGPDLEWRIRLHPYQTGWGRSGWGQSG